MEEFRLTTHINGIGMGEQEVRIAGKARHLFEDEGGLLNNRL